MTDKIWPLANVLSNSLIGCFSRENRSIRQSSKENSWYRVDTETKVNPRPPEEVHTQRTIDRGSCNQSEISWIICLLYCDQVYLQLLQDKCFGCLSRKVSKVDDRSRGRPEGSLFNCYYTEVYRRALLLSLDFSILPLIRTLYCWVLSKAVSSAIFKVFGMTRTGIEPRSPLANTLPTRPLK